MSSRTVKGKALASLPEEAATEPVVDICKIDLSDPEVVVRDIHTDSLSERVMCNPDLTLLARDLTDVAELRRLREQVVNIQDTRLRCRPKSDNPGFLSSVYVLGGGADYSDQFPYRAPEAQDLREELVRQGALFFERPEHQGLKELSAHVKKILSPARV